MEFKVGNSIVNSYKRLSYTPWYALAEFIDNSTQAYFDNEADLQKMYKLEGSNLFVKINYDSLLGTLRIEDNSMGMDEGDLDKALTVGLPPDNVEGRSKYGLGMKTASFWFGDRWEIKTKKLGNTVELTVEIDLKKVQTSISKPTKLNVLRKNVDLNQHYTIISIFEMNREIKGRTLGKVKDYLRSIYRLDFRLYGLKLYWQNDLLNWYDVYSQLFKLPDGSVLKKDLKFELSNGKSVHGWVGVLGPKFAGRKHAGFSLIKARRVIEGWPRAFKPSSIYGDLDDGVNDLVNQRVIGELYLDDFEVSHTKDSIIWLDNEYEEIDNKLGEFCADIVYYAKTLRFRSLGNEDSILIGDLKNESITLLESELKSDEFHDFLETYSPPEEELIKFTFEQYKENSKIGIDPDLEVELGIGFSQIKVFVYFISRSEFDPYVVIDASVIDDTVTIIINAIHPHFLELETSQALTNFIRHCIYDGVSEWKSIKLLGEIKPFTIKNIKDGLLRIPFVIKQNKV